VADRTSDGRPIRMLTAGSLGVSSPPIAYARMVLLGNRTPSEFARPVDGHAHLPALHG